MARRNAARARVERERRAKRYDWPVEKLADYEFAGAIYALQTARGRLAFNCPEEAARIGERIRELIAERNRRQKARS